MVGEMIEFNTKITLRCYYLGCGARKEVYGTVVIHPSVEVASVPDSLPVAEVRITKAELDGWHQFADGDYWCSGC